MTEPTDNLQQRCAEIVEWQRTGVLSGSTLRDHAKTHWAGYHDSLQMAERDTFTKAVEWVAKWGTSPAVAKWAPEELADGKRGIRWVTEDGIHGRPTDHDVREYLKRTPTAHGCHCGECKQFYTTPQPTQAQAGAVPLTTAQKLDLISECKGMGGRVGDAQLLLLIEHVEMSHGIKGGQHGADN